MKKITLITQSHLCRNPRVLKEALFLSAKGFDVSILTSTYSEKLRQEDLALIASSGVKLTSVVALETGGATATIIRMIKRIAGLCVRFLNIQTPLALGYGSWQYLKAALQQNADLYIGHQEMGLYCGVRLLNRGKRVAFDFEDWYSEDLLPEAIKSRPVNLLRILESEALKRGVYCTTTSNVLAETLAVTYNAPPPVTIYNTFEISAKQAPNPVDNTVPSRLLWFSQTIGAGRGLERFIHLLNSINLPVEIHLLGATYGDFINTLRGQLRAPHKLLVHPLVGHAELPARIADFDIGLALEEASPKSRELTITNKFFQYLLSGLPVIATATKGQMEMYKKMQPGFLINDYDDPSLPGRLQTWLRDRGGISAAKERAQELAEEVCWEKESEKLLKVLSNAI